MASAQGTKRKPRLLFVKHGSRSDLKDFVGIYDGLASGTDQLMGHGDMGKAHALRHRLGWKRGSWEGNKLHFLTSDEALWRLSLCRPIALAACWHRDGAHVLGDGRQPWTSVPAVPPA